MTVDQKEVALEALKKRLEKFKETWVSPAGGALAAEAAEGCAELDEIIAEACYLSSRGYDLP